MEPAPHERERRSFPTARALGALVAALMVWSVMAAPPGVGQDPPIEEPEDLAAYATIADAAPVQLYFDHQVRLIPLGPAIAHSQSEVSLPSAASAIAWLVDGGVANGLHGTSTGASVPTEATAQQPGGDPEAEFLVAGGPIGEPAFAEARAGRAYAQSTRGNEPRGYGNAFLSDLVVLPASGTPPDSPGTYDPNASPPSGDEDETDPAPRGRMAILAIGDISSTSESIREGSTVTSVSVAELKEINIGNRTADNRCANCIRIDKIRVEAFAQANGTVGGSKGAYRVTLGRACRRSFDAETGAERDQCLPLDPRDSQGTDGLQSVPELEMLNEQFSEPIWTRIPGAGVDYIVGVRITAGSEHREDSRSERTTTPPDDPHRNYAYPDLRPRGEKDRRPIAPDRDDGEVARAVAEGPDIEIWSITVSQVATDVEKRVLSTPAQQILAAADQDPESPGIQVIAPGPAGDATGTQTISTGMVRSTRRLHLTLGMARASATARSIGEVAPVPEVDAGAGASFGAAPAPPVAGEAPAATGGQAGAAPVGGGLTGPFALKIDWSSFRVRPWAPDDMAKGIGIGGIAGGALWLLRRRLFAT